MAYRKDSGKKAAIPAVSELCIHDAESGFLSDEIKPAHNFTACAT